MSRLKRAAVAGAALAVVAFTLGAGAPPLAAVLDPVIWLVYAFIALAGAFAAVSAVLAWQHAREAPRCLFATLISLLLVSVPLVWPFVEELRDTQRFLATAASTTGIVANKYVRGGVHLVVEYEVAGHMLRITEVGRNPYVGTPAFSEWARGDSIAVYYQPATPEVALVGFPGPDRRALVESLLKVWVIWGVLLTAYLPLIWHRLRQRAAVTSSPVPQAQS